MVSPLFSLAQEDKKGSKRQRQRGQVVAWHGSNHGLRARDKPSLELFSIALVSTSAEMVKRDLERHSCWISTDALPALLKRTFTVVSLCDSSLEKAGCARKVT